MPTLSAHLERTVLHPTASVANLDKAIQEVKQHNLAGLCVPPFWVKKVKRDLDQHPASLATVVGFPMGYQRTETKITEIETALQDGATDLEVSINLSAMHSPTASWIKVELAKCSSLIHSRGALFTVVMEAALLDDDLIEQYCKISADAGADYIKPASGFLTSQLLNYSLVEQITRFRNCLPATVGIKAVAKVHTAEEVKRLLTAGAERVCIDTVSEAVLRAN